MFIYSLCFPLALWMYLCHGSTWAVDQKPALNEWQGSCSSRNLAVWAVSFSARCKLMHSELTQHGSQKLPWSCIRRELTLWRSRAHGLSGFTAILDHSCTMTSHSFSHPLSWHPDLVKTNPKNVNRKDGLIEAFLIISSRLKDLLSSKMLICLNAVLRVVCQVVQALQVSREWSTYATRAGSPQQACASLVFDP